MSRGRIAAAIVAAVAWAGLIVQARASFAIDGSWAGTLWIMLRYFTVMTNIAVALSFTGIALGRAGLVPPPVQAGIMLAILLVGIVYGLLLRGLIELSGGAALADMLLHKATPVLVPLHWLAFCQKGALTPRHPPLWALYPLAYFGYALIRGMADGRYAYPFIDVAMLGLAQVMTNGVAMGIGFLLAGYAVVWIDRRLA